MLLPTWHTALHVLPNYKSIFLVLKPEISPTLPLNARRRRYEGLDVIRH